jgi:hypothetical protein
MSPQWSIRVPARFSSSAIRTGPQAVHRKLKGNLAVRIRATRPRRAVDVDGGRRVARALGMSSTPPRCEREAADAIHGDHPRAQAAMRASSTARP